MKIDKNEFILNRMSNLIETSTENQKKFVERYFSLANQELHKSKKDLFRIAGASYALLGRFESKFGMFIIRESTIFGD